MAEPTEYKDLFFVDEDLLAVQDNDEKYSVINTQGNMFISEKYDDIALFSEQRAAVKIDGK